MDWESSLIKEIIKKALEEDIGKGDVTTDSLVSPFSLGRAIIKIKDKGIIAGLPLVSSLYKELDQKVKLNPLVRDGDSLEYQENIAVLEGPIRSIIKGERVALNFLQRLSGIATMTKKFVKKLEGTGVKILDTRKTTPTLRILEKYAIRVGGGENHRFGLFDMIMIKDNHIAAVGGVRRAIEMVRNHIDKGLMVVVETKDLEEVKEALSCSVDRIMLDNMSLDDIKRAVGLVKGRVPLEASGNVTLERVRAIAEVGVDYISIGLLTTRLRSLDMSLRVI